MKTIINKTKMAGTELAKNTLPKGIQNKVVSPSNNLQYQLNQLLFNPPPQATDWENLTIIIRKDKAHHFDFLKASTRFNVQGKWNNLTEDNVEIQIQYKDTPSEAIGKELMEKLNQYNAIATKEEVLYVRTEPIEETTL